MKTKKIAAAILSAACVLGMTSCAGSGKTSSAATGTPSQEAPMLITMMRALYESQPPKADSPLQKEFEEKMNVKFEFRYVPTGTYSEVFNTTLATNDVPMMIETPSSLAVNPGFMKYCKSGVFWDLTDRLSSGTLKDEGVVTDISLKTTSVGGRNYMLPQVAQAARVAVLYRQDWADKVGASQPKTIDEFYKMAKLFTENDPDGNGKDDTFGFAYIDDADKESAFAGLNTLAVGFGAPNLWGKQNNGSYYPYFESEGYMKALDLLKDMYNKGYMNDDFYLIKGNDKFSAMLSGEAGMMMTSATNSVYPGGKFDPLIQENPNAKISYSQTFNLNGVPVTNSAVSVGALGGTVFPKSACSEKQLDKIFKMFEDSRTDPEIDKLLTLGVKDIHYTETNGKITISKDQSSTKKNDGSGDSSFCAVPIPGRILAKDYGQDLTVTDQITKAMIPNNQYAVMDASVGLMDSDMLTTMTGISTIISDARVKYILGQIDNAGFQAAIQQWKSAGGQSIIDGLNKAAK